jgi:urease accessory protein
VAWPSPVLDELVAANPRPHHPLLVGAVIGTDGGSPAEAAQCAAYLALSGPASAAVRLLGLDPFAVNAAVVALRPVLDAVVAEAAEPRPADRLPAPGAPVLDLMAQAHVHHHREQVRLFVS